MNTAYRSLSSKLTWLVALASLVVALVSAGFRAVQVRDSAMANLEATFHTIEVSHVRALAASMWLLDQAQVNEQLKGMAELPHVQTVRVEGDVNRTAQGDTPPRSRWTPPAWMNMPRVMSRSYPLQHQAEPGSGAPRSVGRLQVDVSLQGMYDSIMSMLWVCCWSSWCAPRCWAWPCCGWCAG